MAALITASNLATGTSNTLSSASITNGGSNRAMYGVVMVADGSPAAVTSLTWTGGGGQALTQIADSLVQQTFLRTYVYRLIAPAVATGTLDLVLSAAQSQVGLLTYAVEDCDQTTPNDTVVFANGNGATPDATVVVSSAAGKLVIDFLQRVSGGTLTPGGGQTQLQQGAVGACTFASSREDGAASVTMSWDGSTNGSVSAYQWLIGALSLNAVGGGGGGGFKPQYARLANQGLT